MPNYDRIRERLDDAAYLIRTGQAVGMVFEYRQDVTELLDEVRQLHGRYHNLCKMQAAKAAGGGK